MAIELTKEETKSIIESIQKYFQKELEIEIGQMQSGFLLKFILTEIAPFAYNKGISDAERYFTEKTADLPLVCYEEGLTYWVKKK